MSTNQSSKTIVFFSMDALGHIHPILPVARELQRRGHRAVILTTRQLSMEHKYRSLGYDIQCCFETEKEKEQEVKEAIDSEEALRKIMQPLVESFRVGLPETFRATYSLDGACGKHFQQIMDNHDLIEAKFKSLNPNLIVVDHIICVPCAISVAPKWVRIYSGFPSVIYSSLNNNCVAGLGLRIEEMTPEMKKYELECKHSLRDLIDKFSSEKGIPSWPSRVDQVPPSPHLNICFGPNELSLEKDFGQLPSNWSRFEHTIDQNNEKVNEFRLPVEFESLPGKLIYFSLGTLVTNDVELINRLLEMMSKSKNKFIVSMGQMHKFIKLYPNMWGEKFLDQRAILPKVDLFITHGGHNSIIESFYYGVPGLIVLPVFADQFDSAQRVEDCGFGVRLNPFMCTEERLLSSIDSILSNVDLRQKMQSIGDRMRSIKYHEKFTDKLLELL